MLQTLCSPRSAFDATKSHSQINESRATHPAGLILEITRGRTRHPRRPVLCERFLIGSSPTCDLCIGGDGIPPLHSMIVRDGGRHRWETFAPLPLLVVNGSPCDSAIVRDGDVVALGPLQFTVRETDEIDGFPAANADEVDAATPSSLDAGPSSPDATTDVAELSAADLVARLEREMADVDAFEDRRELGAEALLQAALQQAVQETAANEAAANVDASRLLDQLEQMAVQLNACAGELERRAGEIARSHESLAETLCHVLEAERHLSERLTSLLERISETGPAGKHNASLTAA